MARGTAASDAEDLPDARPAQLLLQELVQRDGAFQRPVFATTVSLVRLRTRLSFSLPCPLSVGGKMPRFVR